MGKLCSFGGKENCSESVVGESDRTHSEHLCEKHLEQYESGELISVAEKEQAIYESQLERKHQLPRQKHPAGYGVNFNQDPERPLNRVH
jgi:hypothetical protein